MSGVEESYFSSFMYGLRQLYIPTSPSLALKAQKSLLDRFVKCEVEHKRFLLQSGHYLNYIDIKGDGNLMDDDDAADKVPTLILTHGFGSGCGFFFSNYDAFASQFKRVISVDWLGMGASSRPSSAPRLPFFGQPISASEASDLFIDSLEELRTGLNVGNYVLAGHSLGGYLCGRFAMKHASPEMKGLILVSPAGLAPKIPEERIVPTDSLGFRLRVMSRLWDRNYTPQAIARALGHCAPGLVRKVVNRRFGEERWAHDDTQAITDYLYHISALPASGEYAMNTLLTSCFASYPDNPTKTRPWVLAREPIVPDQFAHLKESTDKSGVPLLILYGDSDWLRFPEVNSYLQQLLMNDLDARLSIIPKAGHHLYMDNADHYHDEIHKWVKERVLSPK